MFTDNLLQWHRKFNKRILPWKGIREPYYIWLSEIILQQTRAEQGLPYYEKFIRKYPTVQHLADAPEQELFALWQGLGYYNRCRNLHSTAKTIATTHQGIFPASFEQLRSLKGIGDYTAAAIASFAFRLPHAVVDGNVVRVLSRVFAMSSDPSAAQGKKEFQLRAQNLLDKKKPHLFNQAIMDLGATICTPKNPICDSCPLQSLCLAYQQNKISAFPIKKKKAPLRNRYFHFFLPQKGRFLWITERKEKDIWQNLFTPYAVESETEELVFLKKKYKNPIFQTIQVLSHQRIYGFFHEVPNAFFPSLKKTSLLKVPVSKLSDFAFPRTVIRFFHKKNYL